MASCARWRSCVFFVTFSRLFPVHICHQRYSFQRVRSDLWPKFGLLLALALSCHFRSFRISVTDASRFWPGHDGVSSESKLMLHGGSQPSVQPRSANHVAMDQGGVLWRRRFRLNHHCVWYLCAFAPWCLVEAWKSSCSESATSSARLAGPFGSHVHGLPSVLVPLWHEDKSIAEIAAIASARARRRVFRCLWPGWCAHVDSPRPSVGFNARVPVVGCLRSSRQGVLERTGPKSVGLFSLHFLSGCIFLKAPVAMGHLFLDLGPVHPAPALSVQAFLESVPMGASSFQKNAACPRAAMRVLGGLTLLSTCLQLESDTAFCVSRTCCLWWRFCREPQKN